MPADGRVLQCMQNMQNIQGIPVVPAVRVCARACALTMARFLSVCCSPVCCTAPRRPGWTDATVAGLQTARGRPCAAAHCPLLDSPAVPGVLPRAVLAGPCGRPRGTWPICCAFGTWPIGCAFRPCCGCRVANCPRTAVCCSALPAARFSRCPSCCPFLAGPCAAVHARLRLCDGQKSAHAV